MTEYINKADIVKELERLYNSEYDNTSDFSCGKKMMLRNILNFLDTLETIDPYEKCIQYPSIKAGIESHAETYSFNIESELFSQLTKEQQTLWRKEIEQAVISGGEAGVELARDIRYKENTEAKTVDVERDIEKEISKFIDTNFEKATTGHKISLRRTARYFYELGLERALKTNLKTNLKNK